jgi:hypothetical protein
MYEAMVSIPSTAKKNKKEDTWSEARFLKVATIARFSWIILCWRVPICAPLDVQQHLGASTPPPLSGSGAKTENVSRDFCATLESMTS